MREDTVSSLKRNSFGAGLVALIVATGLPGFSQSVQSTILGSAKDQTGAAVPGVTVEVVNAGTNSSRTVTTDEKGDYRVPNLEPGRAACGRNRRRGR
jgi:protocatechuate 3,4-dioxygenase beta subunit